MSDDEPLMNHGVVITMLRPITVEETGAITSVLIEHDIRYTIAADVPPAAQYRQAHLIEPREC